MKTTWSMLALGLLMTLFLAACPFVGRPSITVQPEDVIVGPGETVTFSVDASGSAPLAYQWTKDGADVPGGTDADLIFDNAQAADEGSYACTVSNDAGSVESYAATLIVSQDYRDGFDEGFARDDWYWQGFDDSYDTLDYDPVYYQGGDIPNPPTPLYERGWYDGIWYAYNDGYFVDYDYAFAIGFSEGYDAAFASDYLSFLAKDKHVENDNGGWGDGYNDGFSEGRVFGANDYEQGLAFDWLDALLDYESGTDLYFEEVDVGTGDYGPVILYVYGTDPLAKKASSVSRTARPGGVPSVRLRAAAKANGIPDLSYRSLPADVQTRFDKDPTVSARGSRPLTHLTATWLERIDDYRSAIAVKSSVSRHRAVSK